MSNAAIQIILTPDATPELIERVQEAFPEAVAPPGTVAEVTSSVAERPVEDVIFSVLSSAERFPEAFGAWWSTFPGGAILFMTLLAAALLAGYAVEYGFKRLIPHPPASEEKGATFRARLKRGLWHLLIYLAGLGVFVGAATVVGRLILPDADPLARGFARDVLSAIVFARLVYGVFMALASPGAPGRRLMGFTEDEARSVGVATLTAMVIFGVVRVLLVVTAAAAPAEVSAAPRAVLVALASVVTAWFFLSARRPVSALIQRTSSVNRQPGLAARYWVWIFLGIIVVDMLLKVIGTLGLLGPGAAAGTGPTIMICTLTPLLVAALSAWRGEGDETNRLTSGVYVLLEGVVIIAAGIFLLRGWGIDPFAPPSGSGGFAGIVPGLVEAAIVAVIGFSIYRTVGALLDGGPAGDEGALVDEENVGGATRLDTVMPIVRAMSLAVIVVVTVLMALAAAGVNIGPLLAGAGVLGLAIGFGAQKLVSDIINGLFFLYEDAFRMNEYIETSAGKGVVERIGLRSVRLRHHRGAVFTISFSDMGPIQNHSRDWVKVKFLFNVPAETDVEMVRKMVKKIGQQLEADPELEGKFLEPLKSQGAVAINGAGYTIGCKFTARPGQQFLIRRKAYAAVQKAMKEKGIDLYVPQLTLNTDGLSQPPAQADASGGDATVVPA
jgi:small-conductance mechanosensitive channel